jgi:nicotinate dehydrogenase subunit B
MKGKTTFPKEFAPILESLNSAMRNNGTSRRNFLKRSGLLVVGFSMASLTETVPGTEAAGAPQAAGPYLAAGPDPKQVDSFIAIAADGTATLFFGKTDNGQGTGTALRQMMADELDVAYENTRIIMGDSQLTVDQGGSSASSSISQAGPSVRRVCAEARRVLLEMASKRWNVSANELAASNGVITAMSDSSKKIGYGQLIGGQRFNTTLTWNGMYGNALSVSGVAKLKPVQELRAVGKPIHRDEIPLMATGRYTYNIDVKVPGMVHGRSVKPPIPGSKLMGVDESSVKNIPGFIKVVTRGNYVGVVCQREEQAIKAAQQLKVNWQTPATANFPTSEGLYDYMRKAPSLADSKNENGNVDMALANAAKVIEATYEFPFNSHASFTPACAVADPTNGELKIWSGTQKIYDTRRGIAELLGMPVEKVRATWVHGPGSYGRNEAGDVGYEAALLASQVGRPVRLQWTRSDATAWDPKGPAGVFKMKAGLDAQGNLVALDYDSTWANANNWVASRETGPLETLVGQMTGARSTTLRNGNIASPAQGYDIPNKRVTTHSVALGLPWESPLRVSNLRQPQSPQTTFAGESFIDEIAAALRADPIQFRLKYRPATDNAGRVRAIAVLKAAAETYGWDTRPSPKTRGNGPIVIGRGISAPSGGGNGTLVATIAEVEVNLQTGNVRVKRLVCAHDCGLVINPDGLRNVVEGNLIQSASRVLKEEVTFDRMKVTSVDWVTYPILRHVDVPDKIDIVIVNGDPNPNRPDLPHLSAGEPSTGPTSAAIANAIFDATGVRIRRAPFTPERVKAALNQKV